LIVSTAIISMHS